MTGGEKPPSSWTPEIVRDHVLAVIGANDRRYEDRFAASDKAVLSALNAQEKAVNAALAASEKAVLVAENNAEKWRANANEWRGTMNDREGKFAQRSDLEALKERLDRSEGKGVGLNAMWGFIVGGIGVVAAVIGLFISFRAPAVAPSQVVYIPAPPNTLLPSTPPVNVPR